MGSSWQQLPDGFLALALADERSALSSRSSMSEGTAHVEGTGHASTATTDDDDSAPELPMLHLEVRVMLRRAQYRESRDSWVLLTTYHLRRDQDSGCWAVSTRLSTSFLPGSMVIRRPPDSHTRRLHDVPSCLSL